MFTWLKKWLGNRLSREPHDLFHPQERAIYRYFNGKELITTDPMVLYKKIMEIAPELDIDIKVANSQSKDAGKSYESMLIKIRNVFTIKSLVEGGLTETETVQLLDHFVSFNERIKKNSPAYATSSESLGASAAYSAEVPTTSNTTPSGSTANDYSTGRPESSPLEPASP